MNTLTDLARSAVLKYLTDGSVLRLYGNSVAPSPGVAKEDFEEIRCTGYNPYRVPMDGWSVDGFRAVCSNTWILRSVQADVKAYGWYLEHRDGFVVACGNLEGKPIPIDPVGGELTVTCYVEV